MGVLGTYQVEASELRDALEAHPESAYWVGAHLLRGGRIDMMPIVAASEGFDQVDFLSSLDRDRMIPLVGNAITPYAANLPPNSLTWIVERHKPSLEMAKAMQETFLSSECLDGLRKLYRTGPFTAIDAATEACRCQWMGLKSRFDALSTVTTGAAMTEVGASLGNVALVRWALNFMSPVPASSIEIALQNLNRRGIGEQDLSFISQHLEKARLREQLRSGPAFLTFAAP